MNIRLPSIENVTIKLRKKDKGMSEERTIKAIIMTVTALMEYLPESVMLDFLDILDEKVKIEMERIGKENILSNNEYAFSVWDRRGNLEVMSKEQMEDRLESDRDEETWDEEDNEEEK